MAPPVPSYSDLNPASQGARPLTTEIDNSPSQTKNATSDLPKRHTGNERRVLRSPTAIPQECCRRTMRPLPAGLLLAKLVFEEFILGSNLYCREYKRPRKAIVTVPQSQELDATDSTVAKAPAPVDTN